MVCKEAWFLTITETQLAKNEGRKQWRWEYVVSGRSNRGYSHTPNKGITEVNLLSDTELHWKRWCVMVYQHHELTSRILFLISFTIRKHSTGRWREKVNLYCVLFGKTPSCISRTQGEQLVFYWHLNIFQQLDLTPMITLCCLHIQSDSDFWRFIFVSCLARSCAGSLRKFPLFILWPILFQLLLNAFCLSAKIICSDLRVYTIGIHWQTLATISCLCLSKKGGFSWSANVDPRQAWTKLFFIWNCWAAEVNFL